jgi:flagellar hook-associated protein 2
MSSVQFLGLASGTDWNSIISQLVSVERKPVDSMIKQRSKLLFNQAVMNNVNTQLTAFNNKLSTMRYESTFLSRQVTSSNPGRVSATADAGAAIGTHNVQVNRLASASRASSGLDGALYSKVANLSTTQTMGIASLTPFGSFQPTRALDSTLIKDTLQAGRGGAGITAGDTITISGNLKDGTAVSGTFTFAGDETDTLTRLGTTIAQVFHGEIAASVGSNGELTFIETDPTVAGDITFNTTTPPLALQFHDNDYSGSTLAFSNGSITAGAGATTRRLVNSATFTTGGLIELNSATDLASLDQVASGALNNGDIIRITGTEAGGAAITSTDFTYTGLAGGQTISDLLTAIDGAFITGTASYQNGKIVLTGTASGTSSLSLNLQFVDSGAATEFELGQFTVAETGRSAAAQMVTTGGFTVEGKGEHLLSSSAGRAGLLVGGTSIGDPSNTLKSHLVTEFDMFTIDVDGAGGALDPVTITGLSEYSTVQDLVDAINAQVPSVTATLVPNGASYLLNISANRGGQDIRIYDVAGGIMDRLIKNGATDLDTATNDGVWTYNATTSTSHTTIVDWFTPDNGGPLQRKVWTGAEGGSISALIGGVAINGTGGAIRPGVALIKTSDSAELNTQLEMHTYQVGSANIAQSPAQHIPALDPTVVLADAGFAITPQNSDVSPLSHTNGFFTINGVQIQVGDVNSTTIYDVLGAINASTAGVTAYFDSANARFYLRANDPGSTGISLGGGGDTSNFLRIAGLDTTSGGVQLTGQAKGTVSTTLPMAQAGFTTTPTSGVFTINGTHIAFDAGVDSLTDLITKINNSGAGVTASYDTTADLFTLTQKLTASTSAFRITLGDPADTSNFLEAVSLTADTNLTSQIGTVRQTAQFSVDGVNYTRNSNSVDDVLEKVKLSLNALTDGAESITLSADAERMKTSILDFVVEYNKTMELLNATPLSAAERKKTAVLTEEDAASMTTAEIEEYLTTRESLLMRQFVAGDSSLRQIMRRIQNLVTGPVENGGQFASLSQLGLTTGQVGAGVDAAKASKGRLFAATSDKDTLSQYLEADSDLQQAITAGGDDLFKLFASMLTSTYNHTGTLDLSGGISVGSNLRFSISDGSNSANVSFNPGTYSQSVVLNAINTQLNSAGMGSSVLAFYDSQSRLTLRSSSTETKSFLQLLDLSTGADSLIDTLGLQQGIFFGPDPEVSGGVALRTRQYISGITGIGGIVLERIKQGGSFDRQIQSYDETITRMEDDASEYEQSLRDKFARLETALSQLQNQSAAVEKAIEQMSSNSSSK